MPKREDLLSWFLFGSKSRSEDASGALVPSHFVRLSSIACGHARVHVRVRKHELAVKTSCVLAASAIEQHAKMRQMNLRKQGLLGVQVHV
eukprot:3676541-Amphidinium_carterae.1